MVATRRTTTLSQHDHQQQQPPLSTRMMQKPQQAPQAQTSDHGTDLQVTISGLLQDRRNLHKLEYTIHSSSGHSVGYSPDRIMEDNPEDQASRWSSPANDQNQFLVLSLSQPVLLATITFGKFNKLHVCNLREFMVLAGPTEDTMVPVLHSGLRNDTEPETFTVKHRHRDPSMFIPSKFVKIIPLASHGSNFNYSIWYVELAGLTDPTIVNRVKQQWQVSLDREAWRLCLDFIRRHPDPQTKQLYKQLSERVSVQVEDEHLRAVFEAITADGADLKQAEQLIMAMPNDLFGSTDGDSEYRVVWSPVKSAPWPSKRGGHQMVWDEKGQLLWLFGGWDGERDLGDLWTFSPLSNQWHMVQQDTRHHGGPSPRSCHKIAMDTDSRKIYVLGRFVEPDQRAHQPLNSELYVYDCENGQWACLSEDTAQDGGPLLLYDHQMVVERHCKCAQDACKCVGRLWVYGGKVVSASPSEPVYSGLWLCELAPSRATRWRLIRPDDPSLSELRATPMLRSRIGHCMLFDEEERLLHILHGQRMKDYLSDYYQYNVDTDTVVYYEKDVSAENGPPPGFTQRGCLISPEPGVKLLLLLSGLVRERQAGGHDGTTHGQGSYDSTQNALWALNLNSSKWTCLYANNEHDAAYWQRMRDLEPCPRYAHQLVSAGRHGVFLFGGNPGDVGNPRLRLDDMWRCGLVRRNDVDSTKRHLVYLLRRQQYREMCRVAHQTKASAVGALKFLQADVAQVTSPQDAPDFERLSGWLFNVATSKPDWSGDDVAGERVRVYEEIARVFAVGKRPPAARLQDYLLG